LECLTKEQLSKRVEDEKKRVADEIRRAKEAREAEEFAKKEKVRIAKEEERKKLEAQREATRLKEEQRRQEAQRQKEAEVQRIAEKKKQEEEARQLAKKKQEEEAARKLAEIEAKKKAELEAKRKAEEAKRIAAETEQKRKADAIAAKALKEQQNAKKCATAAELIEAIGKGQPSNLPECKGNNATPTATASPNAPSGGAPTGGAALNPDLKDIKSLSPTSPPPSSTQPTVPPAPSPPIACSTFADPSNGKDGCPKAGPSSPGSPIKSGSTGGEPKPTTSEKKDDNPFTRQPTAEERAKSEAERAKRAAAVPARHDVVTQSDHCGILSQGARRLECELSGGGISCTRTTTTKSCERGLFGRDKNCTEPIVTKTTFCRPE
jgi:actin-related protein